MSRPKLLRKFARLVGASCGVGGLALSCAAWADERPKPVRQVVPGILERPFFRPAKAWAKPAVAPAAQQKPGAGLMLVQGAQPPQPAQPPQAPTEPTTPSADASTPTSLDDPFASRSPLSSSQSPPLESLSPSQQSAIEAPSTNIVSGVEAFGRNTTDVGDLLGKSNDAVGVEVQRRSPVTADPRIRGFHLGQVNTQGDGAWWQPARIDLDTIVSKINSDNIDNVVILKGPFSVRYGPGFSFLDIQTLPTPRYQTLESHGSSMMSFDSNGIGWQGRQAFWGGDSTFGYRVGYDVLTGNDYYTGDGFRIPTSYNTQNFDVALGLNLTCNSKLELKFFHNNQNNVEFPGLITDINNLHSNSFAGRYILESTSWFDRLVVDAWYNETQFSGDAQRPSKRTQIPQLNNITNLRVPQFGIPFVPVPGPTILNVNADGDASSWGFREFVTWGAADGVNVSLGADLTVFSQMYNEFDQFVFTSPILNQPPTTLNNFSIPRTNWTNPGLFVDGQLPVSDRLTLRSGARVDFGRTELEKFGPLVDPANYAARVGASAFEDQNFFLFSTYITGEYKFNDNWTANLGYAYAERPPALTELYSDGPFYGILQNGFNAPFGNPDLDEERMHMFDLAFKFDYERVRGGFGGFFACISDYITYDKGQNVSATTLTFPGIPPVPRNPANGFPGFPGVPPFQVAFETPFVTYRYLNTELATLWGTELFAEYDYNDWITPFATLSYVEGRDHTRRPGFQGNPNRSMSTVESEALPGIPPLEARVGVRFHDPDQNPRWGVEFLSRIVADQDLFAATLDEQRTGGFTTFDIRAYRKIGQNAMVTAGVENLADRFYREHLDLRTGVPLGPGVYQQGTNFYVGMRVSY